MTFLSRQSIGEIIRTRRTEREMSQRQVAILVQHRFPDVTCSQWTLSLIESGRQEASLSQLGAIASVLDVPVARFIEAQYKYVIVAKKMPEGNIIPYGEQDTEEDAKRVVNWLEARTVGCTFEVIKLQVNLAHTTATSPTST